ncbi:amidohydrolase family protein [Nocardioides jiangxiensis]|uniref:Amidohydrolase family protein n=1 Tax=Nocardioides jiangxiensis TaxID=3064524 RepID=A0ABT9B1B9_9ACTN|nr:amidohydrolase family protein [Nocardioides sp. WY-20]MDO7868109.1 amidohydrolase family protein [Nocardioides sp. WY-20]
MSTITWPVGGVIDPHIHQWDPLVNDGVVAKEARALRRVPRVPRALRWALPRADREFVGDPHHVLKPYLPLDYRADAGGVPVSTVVHIEAAWPHEPHARSVEETRWISGLPFGQDGAPALGAMVVHVDPRWPDAATVLGQHLTASPLVRGVRMSAANHPDPGIRDFEASAGLWAQRAFLDGFAAIAERGLSFELWGYAHQLPDALPLVRAYPETTFVLDHYGTPAGLLGPRGTTAGRDERQRADQLARWRDDVSALAGHPNVVAKHSGLGMPVLGGEVRRPRSAPLDAHFVDTVAPLIRHVHDSFGTARTMWASNFPMDKPGIGIPASITLLLDVLGSYADVDLLLRDVARRTYRLG